MTGMWPPLEQALSEAVTISANPCPVCGNPWIWSRNTIKPYSLDAVRRFRCQEGHEWERDDA